ncbi:hypothetical protein DIPPA_06842 [Diplonema papillatum]|nr:hypothetical protein DIPPA_06842 [Diplonema papillatum]
MGLAFGEYPPDVAALGWLTLHALKRGLTPWASPSREYLQANGWWQGSAGEDPDLSLLLTPFFYSLDDAPHVSLSEAHRAWREDNGVDRKEREVAAFLNSLPVDAVGATPGPSDAARAVVHRPGEPFRTENGAGETFFDASCPDSAASSRKRRTSPLSVDADARASRQENGVSGENGRGGSPRDVLPEDAVAFREEREASQSNFECASPVALEDREAAVPGASVSVNADVRASRQESGRDGSLRGAVPEDAVVSREEPEASRSSFECAGPSEKGPVALEEREANQSNFECANLSEKGPVALEKERKASQSNFECASPSEEGPVAFEERAAAGLPGASTLPSSTGMRGASFCQVVDALTSVLERCSRDAGTDEAQLLLTWRLASPSVQRLMSTELVGEHLLAGDDEAETEALSVIQSLCAESVLEGHPAASSPTEPLLAPPIAPQERVAPPLASSSRLAQAGSPLRRQLDSLCPPDAVKAVDPAVHLVSTPGFPRWINGVLKELLERGTGCGRPLYRATHTLTDDTDAVPPNRSVSFAYFLLSGALYDPTACPASIAFAEHAPLLRVDLSAGAGVAGFVAEALFYLPELSVAASLAAVGELYHPRTKVADDPGCESLYGFHNVKRPSTLPPFLRCAAGSARRIPDACFATFRPDAVGVRSRSLRQRVNVAPETHLDPQQQQQQEQRDLAWAERAKLARASPVGADLVRLAGQHLTKEAGDAAHCRAFMFTLCQCAALPFRMRASVGAPAVSDTEELELDPQLARLHRSFAIATFNTDGRHCPAEIARLAASCDVVVLTEVHKPLADSSPSHWREAGLRLGFHSVSEAHGLGTLVASGLGESCSVEFVGRLAVEDRSFVCVSSGPFFVVGFHLDHLTEVARLRQLRAALQWLEDLGVGSKPHCLVGDFNALVSDDYTEDKLAAVATHRALTEWEPPRFEVSALLVDSGYVLAGEKDATETSWAKTRIDHMWFKHWPIPNHSYRVLPGNSSFFDHRPVLATVPRPPFSA